MFVGWNSASPCSANRRLIKSDEVTAGTLVSTDTKSLEALNVRCRSARDISLGFGGAVRFITSKSPHVQAYRRSLDLTV